MMISLDLLSSRYHLLPSQVMQQATTFDLHVLDVASRYAHYQSQVANGTHKPSTKLTENQMKEMLEQVRGANK